MTGSSGPGSVIAAAKSEVMTAEEKKRQDWLKYLKSAKAHMSEHQWKKIPAAERNAVDALPD
jgi:uncharacterized protein YnzC (UPF0291/DUF896 family)